MATLKHGSPVMADHTPSSAVTGGNVVDIGNVPTIAHSDIAADAIGAMAIAGGIYTLLGDAVIAAGKRVWYDGTSKVSETPNGAGHFGITVSACTGDDAEVDVYHAPDGDIRGSVADIITDPGDAGAIPVVTSGSVGLVSAGAETRTLAIPTFAGQMLSLGMTTDGGDIVITAAVGVNQTGNTSLTFADAGDHLLLMGVYEAAALVWRIVANDGIALA